MLQVFDITVPSNGADFPISAPGSFIYFLNGSAGGADTTLKVKAGSTGSFFLLKPGQGMRLPPDAKTPDIWHLSNYALTQAITGQVVIGDGEFEDHTTSGTVQVVDGAKSRSLAGNAFAGQATQSGVAAQAAINQIWNPASSGKNLILEAVLVSAAAAGYFNIKWTQTMAATLGTANSKKLGNAAGVGQLRNDSTATPPPGANTLATGYVQANSAFQFKFIEPIVIPPGYGVSVNSAGGNDLTSSFEWFEENQ